MAGEASGSHDDENVMTSAMLKALAHPLRRRVINELVRRGHARAADLADGLDVPANTLSFHLRVLADAALIEEAAELARDRRDRVWKPAEIRSLALGSPEHPMEDELAGAAFMRLIAEEHYDLMRRVISQAPEYVSGRDPVMRATFQQRHVRLTRAEFDQVMERVAQVFLDAEQAHDADAADSLMWQIDLVAADDTI